MSERLLVEQVRADEVVKGDEVAIVEFRGRVASSREGPATFALHAGKPSIYVSLESDEGAELYPDCMVLRVIPSPPEPDEVDKLCCCSSECDSWECPIHGC
jgi:hypothetical protein